MVICGLEGERIHYHQFPMLEDGFSTLTTHFSWQFKYISESSFFFRGRRDIGAHPLSGECNYFQNVSVLLRDNSVKFGWSCKLEY